MHVLAAIVAFFLTIIAANAIFITLAVKSFPGEQEAKSYRQGLAYNDKLAAREAQAALGWTAEISSVRHADGAVAIDLVFASATATPVSGLVISGALSRTIDNESDRTLEFYEVEPGRYQTTLDGIEPGAWRFASAATSDQGAVFILEKRLVLQ